MHYSPWGSKSQTQLNDRASHHISARILFWGFLGDVLTEIPNCLSSNSLPFTTASSVPPRTCDTLIRSQARELTQLRQTLQHGKDDSVLLKQHLKDLLTHNDQGSHQGQGFRERLSEGYRLAERIACKLSPGEAATDPDSTDRLLGPQLIRCTPLLRIFISFPVSCPIWGYVGAGLSKRTEEKCTGWRSSDPNGWLPPWWTMATGAGGNIQPALRHRKEEGTGGSLVEWIDPYTKLGSSQVPGWVLGWHYVRMVASPYVSNCSPL